ncbi:hypothetical protein PRZ48_014785 [Zasmidium cellare]|uniref:Uncharacterized protein n=1 Tax=Zasmidium cellare TaxID=395010 RepID=A0ABR0DZ91_ZASCE|nr:hypothetical protein PRZ48_014785 [Zasmidium cellare]
MKAIPPLLTQTERENENLKLELEKTKAKLAAANLKIVKLEAEKARRPSIQGALNRRDSAYSTVSSSTSGLLSISPSYARPTAASLGKTNLATDTSPSDTVPSDTTPSEQDHTNKATIHGVDYYYVDGCISEQDKSSQTIGYLKHTTSSSYKTSSPYRALQDGIAYTTQRSARSDLDSHQTGNSSWDPLRDTLSMGDDEASCALTYNPGFNGIDPNQIQALNDRTRLWDLKFYDTPAGQVHLRFTNQLQFLKKAHVHAQDALWHGLRQKDPEAQKFYYRHGPRSVKFGREEIDKSIGTTTGKLSSSVHSDIYSLVELRNAIAHPRTARLQRLDHLMQHAQSLACSIGDEKIAVKVRQLRDEMQRQATRVHKAIVAYEPYCHLPNPRVEPLHHQELFGEVSDELSRSYGNHEKVIARFGPEVVRVVKQWETKHIKPGDDDPEYTANMAKRQDAWGEAVAKWQAGTGPMPASTSTYQARDDGCKAIYLVVTPEQDGEDQAEAAFSQTAKRPISSATDSSAPKQRNWGGSGPKRKGVKPGTNFTTSAETSPGPLKDRLIESLKLELETSKAEIERLLADNKAYTLGKRPSRRRDSGHGTASSSPTSSVTSIPSYARPTKASLSKSIARVVGPPVSEPQVEEEEDHVKVYGDLVYVDGKLEDPQKEQQFPGYMRMTLTASNKLSWTQHTDFLRRNKVVADDSVSIPSPAWASATWGDSVFTPATSQVIHIDASQVAIQSLAQKSGLHDKSFFPSTAGRIHIRFSTQLKLLKRAHRITQNALWHALRDRWLVGQKSIGLSIGHHLSDEVQNAVYNVVDLRNAIVHLEIHSSCDLDRLMRLAQSLVCRLGDEDRAMEIRGLRDKLRQKSTACYEAIIAYAGLSHLPEAQSEPVHHQSLYAEIKWELMRKKESDVVTWYGSEVVEAAKEWIAKEMRIGEDDPDDCEEVEQRVAGAGSKMADGAELRTEALDAAKQEEVGTDRGVLW